MLKQVVLSLAICHFLFSANSQAEKDASGYSEKDSAHPDSFAVFLAEDTNIALLQAGTKQSDEGANTPSSRASAEHDPCDSHFRSTCGRLVISILSAGESPNHNPYPSGTKQYSSFDPFRKDIVEADAFRHLKQFSPITSGALPVIVVAISSDSGFNATAERMLKTSRTAFAGAQPNSLETFKYITQSDSKLNQAIRAFESYEGCQRLMKKENLDSVLPLLKVEVLIEAEISLGHDLIPGIPTWSGSKMTGSISKWEEDGGHSIKSEQWRNLMESVGGSIVQTYINSCEAGAIAAAFESASEDIGCSCFVASTNQIQRDYSGGRYIATFNEAIPDFGERLVTDAPNYWLGAENANAMLPLLYNKYSTLVFPKRGKSTDPYKLISTRATRNPFSAFIYTSADALAEEGLKKVANISDQERKTLSADEISKLRNSVKPQDIAKADFYAQATNELATNQTRQVGGSKAAQDICDRITNIEHSYSPYYKEEPQRFNSFGFGASINEFVACIEKNPRTPSYCEKLIAAKDAILARSPPTIREQQCQNSYNDFQTRLKSINPVERWEKYVGGKVPISYVFEDLEELRSYYEQMKDDLSFLLVQKAGTTLQVDPQVEKAFNHMATSFESAYAGIRNQVFKDLRRDAIRLKLEKIKRSAQLVAENASAMPEGYSDEFLKKMISKLNCLSGYAVGPKFDEQLPGPIQIRPVPKR